MSLLKNLFKLKASQKQSIKSCVLKKTRTSPFSLLLTTSTTKKEVLPETKWLCFVWVNADDSPGSASPLR